MSNPLPPQLVPVLTLLQDIQRMSYPSEIESPAMTAYNLGQIRKTAENAIKQLWQASEQLQSQ